MTSIATFVLDCAASGRWRRGLMALHSSTSSCEKRVRHAAVALAVVAAPHDWKTALSLLHRHDTRDETALVCGVVASLARNPLWPARREVDLIMTLIGRASHQTGASDATPPMSRQLSSSPLLHHDSRETNRSDEDEAKATRQAQTLVILQAMRWCSLTTAESLCEHMNLTPPRREGAKRPPAHRTRTHSTEDACLCRLDAIKSLSDSTRHIYGCLPFAAFENTTPSTPSTPRGRRAREQARIEAHRTADVEAAAAQARSQAVLSALKGRSHSAVVPAALALPTPQQQPLDSTSLALLNSDALRYPAATDLGTLLDIATHSPRGPVPVPTAQIRAPGSAPPPPPLPPSLSVSWQLALSLVHASPTMTPEVFPLYVRCVGLCAPHAWGTALRLATSYWARYGTGSSPTRDVDAGMAPAPASSAEGSQGKPAHAVVPLEEACLVLWMLSRGNWSAAVQFYTTTQPTFCRAAVLSTSPLSQLHALRSPKLAELDAAVGAAWYSFAEDCFARTSVPLPVFLHHFPSRLGNNHTGPRRPSLRLPVANRRAVARALATGARLEEIQLSAVARRWAAEGHWHELLSLYERLPTEEFQRRLVQCLTTNLNAGTQEQPSTPSHAVRPAVAPAPPHSAIAIVQLLADVSRSQHRRQRGRAPPPGTNVTWTLIRACRDAREALSVFRRCVQLGTVCKPQLVSGLMDMGISAKELRAVMASYPGAMNDGIRRRAAAEFGVTMP